MVSCKEVNEYSKLVIFYAGLDEGTRQKFFEREHVLESLDEALVLGNTLLVENFGSGISYKHRWKRKASIPEKHKQEKNKNFKRKFEEGDHKGKKEASGSGDKKKSRHDNDTCYNCQEKGHIAKDCTKLAKPRDHKGKKVLAAVCETKANSVLSIVSKRLESETTMMGSSKEVQSPLKKKKKVMDCQLPRIRILEGGFEAKLNMMSHQNGLVYLQGKLKNTNVLLLLDTGATNSFMSASCVRRLGLEVKTTKKLVKVTFAQGSGVATQIVAGLSFEASDTKFVENFTVCELSGLDFVLGNTFLDSYRVEIRKKPKFVLLWLGPMGNLRSLVTLGNQC